MDMLKILLSQTNIDLNISDERLAPSLLWVLQGYYWRSSDGFVLRLIGAGGDINISTNMDEPAPLHYSVMFINYCRFNL